MFKTKKAEEYQLKGGGALNPTKPKVVSKSTDLFKSELSSERKPLTKKTLPPVIKPGMALPKYDDELIKSSEHQYDIEKNLQEQQLKELEKRAELERSKQEKLRLEQAELDEKQHLKELLELEKQQKEKQKHLEKLVLDKKQKQQAQLDGIHQSQQKQQKQKVTPTTKKTNNIKATAINRSTKTAQDSSTESKNSTIPTNSAISLIRSYIIWWSVVFFIMGIVALSYMYYVANQSFGDGKKMTEEVKNFIIKRGENPFNALNRQQVPTTWTYWFWSKFYNLKAGSYEVRYENSLFDLLAIMEKGKSIEEKLRFEEGKNIYDLFAYLKQNNNVEHDITNQNFTSEMKMVETVLEKLNIAPEQIDFWGINHLYNYKISQNTLLLNHLEGLFFPDTFFVDGLITESKLLKQSFELMQKKMQKAWLAKADNLPYKTPYEALIMASLIEKESGENGERSKISGVFFNRLQKGMPLQTDPTAKYGMQVHQANHILANDFNMSKAVHTQTEYNTYNINGLPPTPICLPSFESIEAALHPAKHEYLFFYASSQTGKTVFKKTLEEHNQEIQMDR